MANASNAPKSKKMRLWILIIILLVVLNVLAFIFYRPLSDFAKKTFSPGSGWYAVHLTNGHVYFGQIKALNPTTIEMVNTYYLEAYTTQPNQTMQGENLQLQSVPQTTYNLIRRGNDNFLTTDHVLFINRQVVLFWEKLASNAGILEWIKKAEAEKQ